MTCPNRDGKVGNRGCIFCSQGGSGDFAASQFLTISEQLEEAKTLIQAKVNRSIRIGDDSFELSDDVPNASELLKKGSNKDNKQMYIAYFQAYTNTYAPVSYLRKIFYEAIESPDVAVLSIATRPDCLEPEVIELLDELNKIKPVWIELGLQTIHDSTARFIRRGYKLDVFDK
ncbi:MAG: radical SAM protein, partial [Lachnospiraceae bacterium]|nr:radical SAM protein [Lachnospiraceae bacterium]